MRQLSDAHKFFIALSFLLLVAAYLVHNSTTKRELKDASKVAGTLGAITGSALTIAAFL